MKVRRVDPSGPVIVDGQGVVDLIGVEARLAASSALRDFVRESNAGRHVWFLPYQAALEARLTSAS